MTSRNLIRRVNAVVIALLLVLAAVPAHAFPIMEEPSAGWSLGSLWEAFRSLVAGVWQEEGSTGTGDAGMLIDPNGLTVDEGIMIDPNG